MIILLLALLAGAYLLCTVRHVEVVGNEKYSAEEIEQAVLTSKWDYNTIYLFYQTHYRTVQTPPFLDLAEIEIVSFQSIRIHAYEKTAIGYVEHEGGYVYFDKEGMVLEISDEMKDGFPVVRGLEFGSAALYETLPVKDKSVFQSLLNLTQLLEKNALSPDSVEFTEKDEIDVTFGEVIVHLGKDESMDNKVARLTSILPQLEGRSGELAMQDVDESTERIIFTKKKSQAQLEQEAAEAAEAAAQAEAEAEAAKAQAEEDAREEEYAEAYQQALWDAEWCEENGEEYDWDAFYAQWGDGSE